MIDKFYDYKNDILINKLGITNKEELEKAEGDIVSSKIKLIEEDENFTFTEDYFRYIHQFLFEDVYDFAGKYREINIEKPEVVLGGLSVKYEDYKAIKTAVQSTIAEIKVIDIKEQENKAEFIADLMIKLWLIHGFREGNTRTVIIFICKYLQTNGIKFKNDVFKENAVYVRKALVAACFEDKELDVYVNKSYILEVINDILEI